MRTKRRLSPISIIIHIIMYALALFWLYPYIWMVLASLKPTDKIMTTPFFQGPFSFTNYSFLLHTSKTMNFSFLMALANSIFIAVVATVVVVISSAIVGYGLAKFEFKGKKFILGYIVFQMVFPSFMFIIPQFILMRNLHLINTYSGIILVYLMSAMWCYMCYQNFKSTPSEYIEAARIDGATELWIVFRLMMPLNRTIMSIIAIFTFAGVWNDFLWPMVVMQNYGKMPLAVLLSNFNMQYGVYLGPVMAGSVILALPIVIGFIILRKYFLEGWAVSLK